MRKLYVLMDTVAKQAGPVFEAPTDAAAQRSVALMKAPRGTRANDFELYHVGEVTSQGEVTGGARTMLGTFPAEDVNE